MIQVRATAFGVLAVIGCDGASPPPASPLSPASSASVALAQEMPSDTRELEPSAPSRSLLVTGTHTIGRSSPAEAARSYRGARIDLDEKGPSWTRSAGYRAERDGSVILVTR